MVYCLSHAQDNESTYYAPALGVFSVFRGLEALGFGFFFAGGVISPSILTWGVVVVSTVFLVLLLFVFGRLRLNLTLAITMVKDVNVDQRSTAHF